MAIYHFAHVDSITEHCTMAYSYFHLALVVALSGAQLPFVYIAQPAAIYYAFSLCMCKCVCVYIFDGDWSNHPLPRIIIWKKNNFHNCVHLIYANIMINMELPSFVFFVCVLLLLSLDFSHSLCVWFCSQNAKKKCCPTLSLPTFSLIAVESEHFILFFVDSIFKYSYGRV